MYELSDVAANDIEEILERSMVDFGSLQTQKYYQSLKSCLTFLGENPGLGTAADDIDG